MADSLSRKARNRGAACDQNDIETIRLKGIGNAAGAGDVADTQKVLDIKKDGRALFRITHGAFSHSVSNRAFSSTMLVR